MSTLSEHQASGYPTEARSQSEDTIAQINDVLQHLDVLSSKAERHIFKYAYLYFFSLFLLDLLLLIIIDLLRGYSKSIESDVTGSRNLLLIVVGISLILWTFNVWWWSVPKTLRDVYEKRRINVPIGNVNRLYLGLLEHYRDALSSPKRYLLIGSLIVIMAIYIVFDFDLPGFIKIILASHPDTVSIIFFSTNMLLIALVELGFAYCLGIVAWTLYISGHNYIRRLSQAFEFKIEPVHPDHCGGLKVLGNFCFGSASPILIGSVFFICYIFVFRPTSSADYLETIGLIVLIILLYALPLAIFAFFLPLWNIHTKMLSKQEANEEEYAARIAILREQIQVLIDKNQLEEAKTMKEKKEVIEALYTPYPTWPFKIRAKFFSAFIGASGSLLLAFLTGLEQPLIQALLQRIAHRP